jgi:hypothetical protein
VYLGKSCDLGIARLQHAMDRLNPIPDTNVPSFIAQRYGRRSSQTRDASKCLTLVDRYVQLAHRQCIDAGSIQEMLQQLNQTLDGTAIDSHVLGAGILDIVHEWLTVLQQERDAHALGLAVVRRLLQETQQQPRGTELF